MQTAQPALFICVVLALGAVACSSESKPAATAPPAAAGSTAIGQLPSLDNDALLAETKMLSSDEFEGRGPGTKGEELATNYLADRTREVGLKPGYTHFLWTAPTSRRCRSSNGITPAPASLVFKKAAAHADASQWKSDVIAWTQARRGQRRASTVPELVFAGYGVVAPEVNWDDYEGVDVEGQNCS